MENSEYIGITVLQCTTTALAILLNSLGKYLLSRIRNTRTSQNIIPMINLSFAEILMSITGIVQSLFGFLRNIEINKGIQKIIKAIPGGLLFTYYLLMISMTSNRLFVSVFPIKYQIIMAQRKAKIALALSWVAGLTFALIAISLPTTVLLYLFATIILPMFNGLFIFIALITYFFILYRRIFHNVTLPRQCKNWSIMAASGRNCR